MPSLAGYIPRVRRGLVVVLLLVVARASALPLLELRPGGSPFSGPTEPDPTAAWWNPAALGAQRGWLHVMFNGSLALERGAYDRSLVPAATGLPGNGTTAFPSTSLASNRYGYFGALTSDFGLDNFTLALAVYAPWDASRSLATPGNFSSAQAPAGYHLVSESYQNIFITVAAALRLLSWLDIGVSITPVDSWTDLTLYRDAALDGGSATVSQPNRLCGGRPCGYENPLAAQKLVLHGDGGTFWSPLNIPKPTGLGIGLGVLLHVGERVQIGVSWMHVVPLPADSSAYDRPYSSPSAVAAAITPALGQGAPCGGSADAPHACLGGDRIAYAIPDVYHLGARFQLRSDVELAPWVRVATYGGYGGSNDPSLSGLVISLSGPPVTQAHLPQQIVIARALSPSVTVELLGLRWRAVDSPRAGTLRLALSAIYQSPAVPADHVDAAVVDGHKLDATLGMEWRRVVGSARRRPVGLRFTAAAGFTGYLPVEAKPGVFDPSARVACVDSAWSIDQCAADLHGAALPTAAGRYTLLVPHFTAGVGVDWW